MPATATYKPTGDPSVDAVLTGIKWAVTALTYSFPTAAAFYGSNYGSGEPGDNFKAFNPAQQSATRSALHMYASVANVTFTQVTETSNQHGDLRLAESDHPATAWGYYPYTGASGGDAWFNNSSHYYDNPTSGNYAWSSIIHELGHTMGLKHPHEVIGAFGTMPQGHDSLEYSVMSYHSYVGSPLNGYTNETWGYPQSLMMYDIAALQVEYGANYATNSGDTTYKWDPTTGQMSVDGVGQEAPGGNRIFLTVWDGGGKDTYDFSNYTTDLHVNLQPGQWTTVSNAQLANLGSGHVAVGNIANALLYHNNPASLIENAIGGSGNDTLIGNSADNTFTGGPGNDSINGVSGINTAVYSGLSSDYSRVQNSDGSWTVVDLRAGSPDGTDALRNIEYLKFTDTVVALQTPSLPHNAAPVANNDTYATGKHQALKLTGIGVLANDTDANGHALSAALVIGPSHGTLKLDAVGSFIYTPTKKFVGTDSFTYKASDGTGSSNVATVSINVSAVSSGKSNKKGHDLTAVHTSDHAQGDKFSSMANDQILAPLGADGFHQIGFEPTSRVGFTALSQMGLLAWNSHDFRDLVSDQIWSDHGAVATVHDLSPHVHDAHLLLG